MSKVVKKLKEIRRAIKNIPSKNIALDRWVTKDDDSYKNCIMCPAAWITTDVFVGDKLTLGRDGFGGWTVNYKKLEGFGALAQFIGITEGEAEDLFGPAFKVYSGEINTDKKVFLNRIKELIEVYE